MAEPMPPEAPVTSTTLPAKSGFILAGREKASEDWRNLARDAAQAGPARQKLPIQFLRCKIGGQNLFDKLTTLDKAFAPRMALIQPMLQQPRAHFRNAPHTAAIFEASFVLIIPVRPPHYRISRVAQRGVHTTKISNRCA